VIDRVNVRAKRVPANAELGLDRKNVLGPNRPARDEPIAHGGLTPADDAAEGRLPAGLVDGEGKGPIKSGFNRHSVIPNGVPLVGQTEKQSRTTKSNAVTKPRRRAGQPIGAALELPGGEELKTVTGERIQQRLDELGISQAELARRCNLAQSTVNGLIIGTSRSSAHLHVIARELSVSTAWLAGVSAADDRGIEGEETAEHAAERLGLAIVPAVELSAFNGGDLSMLPVVAHVPVSRAWVHDWLGSKDKGLIFVARAEADDMQPTFGRGDLLMLDAGELEVRQQDSLWALAYGGVGVVKRVRRLADGSLELRSDNPAVPPIVAQAGEVKMLGHVAAVIRRV